MRIAVSGGIGSGKSTFCGFLRELGFRYFNADEIAHSVLREEAVSKALLERFGTLERPRIAEVVFQDEGSYRWLCDLVHPKVHEVLRREISSIRPEEEVVVEIPLLFEAGVPGWADMTVFVRAGREIALSRLSSSRGWSESELDRRQRYLLPEEHKAHLADLVVLNDGDLKALRGKAESLARRVSAWGQVVDFEAIFPSPSEAEIFLEEATRSHLAALGWMEPCRTYVFEPSVETKEAFRVSLKSVSLNSGELARLAGRVGHPHCISWKRLSGGSWRHLDGICLLCGLVEGPMPKEL